MATEREVSTFFETIGPLVVQVCKERNYGNAQAWTCICQAACESAYGTSSLMKNANAYFGVKASLEWVRNSKYGGKVYSSKTKECYDGNSFVTITDTFRAYDSMIDSIRDYFDLIEGARYKESLKARTVQECISIIKKGGYATDPMYTNTICKIFSRYRNIIEAYNIGQEQKKDSDRYIITANLLNVRSAPGTDSDILTTVKRDDIIEITEKQNVFSNTWGKCSKGWISLNSKYVRGI